MERCSKWDAYQALVYERGLRNELERETQERAESARTACVEPSGCRVCRRGNGLLQYSTKKELQFGPKVPIRMGPNVSHTGSGAAQKVRSDVHRG
jgi:hypothetical protein